MISQNQIKFLRSLEQKKIRMIEKKIILDGKRIINEAINQQIDIQHIWISEDSSNKEFIEKIKLKGINFSHEKDKDIKKISNTLNTQGVLALISIDKLHNSNLNKINNQIVILDQISDPGNLGTIIRTCAWFGIDSIILTTNSVDVYNYKCIRSAVGGHFYMKNIAYLTCDKINNFLSKNNYFTLSADKDGEKIDKININKKWALILGSEAHGIDKKLNFDSKIRVEGKNKIESLNVSIAGAILLNKLIYED